MNFNCGHFWVIFGQNTKVIAWYFAHGHFWVNFGQNIKVIALLFGQKWLILITFQCAIKLNEFQFWSFLGDFWAKYQGYSLTFWPKMADFDHFSICNQKLADFDHFSICNQNE